MAKAIKNPREYDKKQPTNLRLKKSLKDRLYKDAKETETSLSEIVNRILEDFYEGGNNSEH